MEKEQLITLAYDLAKTKYKNKPFTFEQLWADLVKKARLDAEEQKVVGHVYTCMLQDHRFIFIGNREWKVREFLKEAEQAALSHALYDFKQEEVEESKRLSALKAKEASESEEFMEEEELDERRKQYKDKLIEESEQEEEPQPENESSSEENEDEEDAE